MYLEKNIYQIKEKISIIHIKNIGITYIKKYRYHIKRTKIIGNIHRKAKKKNGMKILLITIGIISKYI